MSASGFTVQDAPLAFWCQSLTDLLLARAYLVSTHWPAASPAPLLIGPEDSDCVFEMDPLRPVVGRVPADLALHRDGWFLRRKRKVWLKGLMSDYKALQLTLFAPPSEALGRLFKDAGLTWQEWSDFGLDSVSALPTLQAGPKSLARSTHLYRKASPHALKMVCVVDCRDLSEGQEAGLFQDLEQQLLEQEDLAKRLHATLAVTYLAFQPQDVLQKRRLKELQPSFLFEGIAGLIGHVAYSDRVISNSPAVTLLCQQMRRDLPVLL